MRRILFGVLATLAALAPSLAFAGDVMVHVGHNSLQPAEVTIDVGDTVTFHNMVEMPGGHTVVSEGTALSSPALAKDQAWSHEFTEAGRFEFHIKEHPGARMAVQVQ
jgi:plastocyanin